MHQMLAANDGLVGRHGVSERVTDAMGQLAESAEQLTEKGSMATELGFSAGLIKNAL